MSQPRDRTLVRTPHEGARLVGEDGRIHLGIDVRRRVVVVIGGKEINGGSQLAEVALAGGDLR